MDLAGAVIAGSGSLRFGAGLGAGSTGTSTGAFFFFFFHPPSLRSHPARRLSVSLIASGEATRDFATFPPAGGGGGGGGPLEEAAIVMG